MVGHLVLIGIGALIASSRAPRAQCRKLTVLGPRSGLSYQAEHYPESGFVIAFGPGEARVTFEKQNDGSYRYVRGIGRADVISLIRSDFERQP